MIGWAKESIFLHNPTRPPLGSLSKQSRLALSIGHKVDPKMYDTENDLKKFLSGHAE